MMHAYNKQYLDDAMRNLGDAFDYVANACKMDMDEFLNLFIAGGIAEQFSAGAPKYVSGLSGVELAWKVMENSGKEMEMPDVEITYERTPEYCGETNQQREVADTIANAAESDLRYFGQFALREDIH